MASFCFGVPLGFLKNSLLKSLSLVCSGVQICLGGASKWEGQRIFDNVSIEKQQVFVQYSFFISGLEVQGWRGHTQPRPPFLHHLHRKADILWNRTLPSICIPGGTSSCQKAHQYMIGESKTSFTPAESMLTSFGVRQML